MPNRIFAALLPLFMALQALASPLPLSIAQADTIFYRQGGTLPSFVHFRSSQAIDTAHLGTYLQEVFAQEIAFAFQLIRSESDDLDLHHLRFQQMRGPYLIEGAIWTLHLDAKGDLLSMGGLLFPPSKNAHIPLFPQNQALKSALLANPAEIYRWEVSKAAPPTGQIVWSPPAGNFSSSQLRLAFKFDIYSSVPIGRTYTYIDAQNGALLWQENRIQTIDSLGIAETAYSGSREIITQYNGSNFSLTDYSRGNGIVTLNARERYYWQSDTEPFTDEDNFWNNINPKRDQFATDAHWGTAQTYDFLLNQLGRNSLDDNGYTLVSHVHLGRNYRNAFWDGRAMYYGDGDSLGGSFTPLVSIDIVAHEITHGLTQNTAGLIYNSESGALNESYSDIMGKAVQQWSKPNTFNWILGEEANFPIRSMQQPNDFNHPNTYKGQKWSSSAAVHTNSGVQNHWFYLLAEGGSGTNDNTDSYQVSSIGIDKATQIALRSLLYYLHPSTTYEEARFYSLQAAADIYGPCSFEAEQVINAWYAVGVGPAYNPPVPKADFTFSNTNLCSYPLEVHFSNLSSNGATFRWDFGDGEESDLYSPSHTYSSPGQYSVRLSLAGNCGSDEKVSDQLITIQTPPEAPEIIQNGTDPVCNEEFSVLAQSPHEIIWYDDSSRIVGTGPTLNLPYFYRSSLYHARSILSKQQLRLANNPLDPNQAEVKSGRMGQYFQVGQIVLLRSIKVQVAAPEAIRVNLIHGNGKEGYTYRFELQAGINTLDLMRYLIPGDNYFLSIEAQQLLTVPQPNSWVDNLPGVFELGYSQVGVHFSHDWQVEAFCESEPASILIQNQIPSPTPIDTATCGPESFNFFVPSEGYTVNWYDWRHRLIHQGENFATGTLFRDGLYYVEREAPNPSQRIGPQIDLSTSYTWPKDIFPSIHFSVTEPIIIESLAVYSDSATFANVYLIPESGALAITHSDSVSAGHDRINVNWLLNPGKYQLRGGDPHLHVLDQGFDFPYEINGLIQIDSFSGPYYPFFFDWEVRAASCWSERVPVRIRHGLEVEPRADFDFRVEKGAVKFQNLSKGYDRVLWDFGDGASSTTANAEHIFGEIGSYEVGLQVWFGGCSDFIHRSITIKNSEPIFQVFPNPAQDLTNLRIGLLETEDLLLEVFDISGRKNYHEKLGELAGGSFHYHQLDLRNWASGWYVVRLSSAQQQYVRRLQVY